MVRASPSWALAEEPTLTGDDVQRQGALTRKPTFHEFSGHPGTLPGEAPFPLTGQQMAGLC